MIPTDKIDLHVHARKEPTAPRRADGKRFATPDELLAIYRAHGIQKGVLLPFGDATLGSAFATNDEVATIAERYPDRFSFFVSFDPRTAKEEDLARRLAVWRERGARGVGEFTASLPFDHPDLFAFFSICEKERMPVLFHLREKTGYGVIDDAGLPRLERALCAFPHLLFIGHSKPFWREFESGRVEALMRRHENLAADLSATSGFTAMRQNKERTAAFLGAFGERIFFGTDICDPESANAPMLGLGALLDDLARTGMITHEAYENVCHQNAARLLAGEWNI